MEADCPTIAMDTRAKVVLVAKTTEGVAGVKKTMGDEASPAEQLDIPINIPIPVVLIDAAECGSTTIKTSSIAQLRYWQ